MKRFLTPKWLTGICAAAGLLCMALRFWLLATGMNDRGLIDRTHPGNRLSWLLAVLVLVLVLAVARNRSRIRLAPSAITVTGGLCSALGCLVACGTLLQSKAGHPLNFPTAVVAVAAAAGRLWVVVNTCRRKRVPPLAYGPMTVFFLLFLVCRYQYWNSEPEPQLCLFHILALVGMALSAYCRGVMLMDRKQGKGYLPISRWAVFAALAAVPGCMDGPALLLWAAALLLDGCSLRKRQ